jgi:hypothetical protein
VCNVVELRSARLTDLAERFNQSDGGSRNDIQRGQAMIRLTPGANDASELLKDGALNAIKCASLHVLSLGASRDPTVFRH